MQYPQIPWLKWNLHGTVQHVILWYVLSSIQTHIIDGQWNERTTLPLYDSFPLFGGRVKCLCARLEHHMDTVGATLFFVCMHLILKSVYLGYMSIYGMSLSVNIFYDITLKPNSCSVLSVTLYWVTILFAS